MTTMNQLETLLDELYGYKLVPSIAVIQGNTYVIGSKMYMHYVDAILLLSHQGHRNEAFTLLSEYIKRKYCS